MFLGHKKYFFGILLGAVIGAPALFAANFSEQMLLSTITSPGSLDRLEISSQKQGSLLAENTFPVRGVAQPNKSVNLYGWSIIPGSDGNTNPDETITNFEAEILAPGQVKLSWEPRTIFRQEYADQFFAQNGLTCSALKNHCFPTDGSGLGAESTNCTEGNVPTAVDCTLPKSYAVYNQIVRPSRTQSGDGQGKISLELSPQTEATVAQTMNTTLLDSTHCPNCEYEFYPVGWQYLEGPAENGETALLNADLHPVSTQSLNVDRANGSVPELDGIGRTEVENIFLSGKYAPNIGTDAYAGAYLFSYRNFIRGYDAATGYGQAASFPIKDLLVLVDDFKQYEVYALESDSYAALKGVTRENGRLVAVVRDPSLETITIDYAVTGLDPQKEYVFAIFEVRENGQENLPDFLKTPLLQKSVSGNGCIGDPFAPTQCSAVLGHLLSSNIELSVKTANASIRQIPSPLKREWEIFEQEGSYTGEPLGSNQNGDLKSGPTANKEIRFALEALNRFARQHFFVGTYTAQTLGTNGQTTNGLSLRTNRAAPDIDSLYTLSAKTNAVATAKDLFGVVFDAWTETLVGNVELELRGTLTTTQAPVRAQQQTSSDALFSFATQPGIYQLAVHSVSDRENAFVFPLQDQTLNVTDSEDHVCENIGIFHEVYCQIFPITIRGNSATHRDIAIEPSIKGKVIGTTAPLTVVISKNNTVVAETTSLPNGKFSFFLPAGSYTISEIRENGTVRATPRLNVTINADANGRPLVQDPITLAL